MIFNHNFATYCEINTCNASLEFCDCTPLLTQEYKSTVPPSMLMGINSQLNPTRMTGMSNSCKYLLLTYACAYLAIIAGGIEFFFIFILLVAIKLTSCVASAIIVNRTNSSLKGGKHIALCRRHKIDLVKRSTINNNYIIKTKFYPPNFTLYK
ncbi:hypothetical protein HBA_0023 [Sodalis endosymbiont of Henestaris halophilus]|nr:hypothetical protein HBA_0023 [Sodalis endosymbiont of Henestaris halophilus]